MQDLHEDHPSTVKDEIEDAKQGLKNGLAFAGGFAGDDERRAEERQRHEEEREAREAESLETSALEHGSTTRGELDGDEAFPWENRTKTA
jgi:uncharacterized protein with von Willebrand factor type A (vWA) domain